MCVKVGEPKTHKWVTKGFLPKIFLFSVLLGCCLVNQRFSMMLVALISSPHRWPKRALSNKRHRVMSSSDRFRCSATPLRCSVCGGVNSLVIPFEEQKSWKA